MALHGDLWSVPILLLLALVCLVAGLGLPIIDTRFLLIFGGSYSLLDGIALLFAEGDLVTAAILAVFSAVAPIVKIVALFFAWLRLRAGGMAPRRLISMLDAIGKWAMLDVLVVALIVFAARASALADANVAPAVIPFTASVALTMVAARLLRRSETAGQS